MLHIIIGTCTNLPEDSGKPSFEAVLGACHRRVYNLAYRLIGNADEAADLTQDTFVKAYKAYGRFQGTADAVYPWLCRIAVNGCKNRFRELGRRGKFEAWSLDDSGDDGAWPDAEPSDESLNPALLIEQREVGEKVQEAVQALPPEFRVIVVLRDMDGLTYKEIAEATGLTLELVKIRLHRGRIALRQRLSRYVTG